MTDDLRQRIEAVRKWPDKCCAEVSRNGESQPCDKPAVAVADGDAESDSWWPVCPHHSRGRKMVRLSVLLSVLQPDIDKPDWLKTPHRWEMFTQPGANIETCRLCGCGPEHQLHRVYQDWIDVAALARAAVEAMKQLVNTGRSLAAWG